MRSIDDILAAALIPILILFVVLMAWSAFGAEGEIKRDPRVVTQFKRTHPCPSTGVIQDSCPQYVVDHVWSLCLGGPDIIENMQWQEVRQSYIKDVFERQMCAAKKRLEAK